MHFGIEIVPFGEYANPRPVMELAQAAEASGWEGVWVWDHLLIPWGVGDPWVILSAVAAVTHRLKLVSGVANLPRYYPQNLARTLVGLDLLSQGRAVLGAGLGGVAEETERFGLPGDARTRAEMLDESLEVITRLWSGEAVSHVGKHYQVAGAVLQPTPVQQPRIPVWIGGESRAALRRAARWDGWIVNTIDESGEIIRQPEQLAKEIASIHQHRLSPEKLEVAIDGISQPNSASRAQDYAEAGATWWFEALFGLRGSHAEILERVQAGPPAA